MKILKYGFLLTLAVSFFLQSCSGSLDGVAPSYETSPVTPTNSELFVTNMKYGSEIPTASGWTVGVDVSDPVVPVTTSNGWKVEIKYE